MSLPTRIRPGAKAIIVKNESVFIIEEHVDDELGKRIVFDVPGGGIEEGELLTEALVREVQEEIGITPNIIRPIGCWDYMRVHSDRQTHIVCAGYLCSISQEQENSIDLTQNPAAENIVGWRWVPITEIAQVLDPVDQADLITSITNAQEQQSTRQQDTTCSIMRYCTPTCLSSNRLQ
ncbi:MAG: NUDIX hydrolase [Pseudomonadales bacterium]|nr:NUDIX hydrolase [Pseudomonadales bacterium]